MPTTTNVSDVQNGPLARAGSELITLYNEYQQFKSNAQNVGNGNVDPSQFQPTDKALIVQNGMVQVDVRAFGSVTQVAAQLSDPSIGMVVGSTNQDYNLIEGSVPIDSLVKVANLTGQWQGQQVPIIYGISPIARSITLSQGSATNNAESVLGFDDGGHAVPVDQWSGGDGRSDLRQREPLRQWSVGFDQHGRSAGTGADQRDLRRASGHGERALEQHGRRPRDDGGHL